MKTKTVTFKMNTRWGKRPLIEGTELFIDGVRCVLHRSIVYHKETKTLSYIQDYWVVSHYASGRFITTGDTQRTAKAKAFVKITGFSGIGKKSMTFQEYEKRFKVLNH